jgi:hypothetical protein
VLFKRRFAGLSQIDGVQIDEGACYVIGLTEINMSVPFGYRLPGLR